MAGWMSRRAVRRLRRNALFLIALLALLVLIVIAVRLAPRTDDSHTLSVPAASDE